MPLGFSECTERGAVGLSRWYNVNIGSPPILPINIKNTTMEILKYTLISIIYCLSAFFSGRFLGNGDIFKSFLFLLVVIYLATAYDPITNLLNLL